MARPWRFERQTHSLEGCCSIQLSYGRSGIILVQLSQTLNNLLFMKLVEEGFGNILREQLRQFFDGGIQ